MSDVDKFKKRSTEQLINILRRNNLSTDGSREELLTRVLKLHIFNNELSDSEDDTTEKSNTEGKLQGSSGSDGISKQQVLPQDLPQVASGSGSQQVTDTATSGPKTDNRMDNVNDPETTVQSLSVTGFSDVLKSIRSFSGDDHMDVEKWIRQFEDTAVIMNWTGLQKLVFAKRSLTGTACLVAQVHSYTTWNALKEMLIEEFKQVKTGAELHAILSKTKKKQEESMLAYVTRMQELSIQGNMDEPSLIQYIINGLEETPTNTVMLYGCNSLKELKTKLRVFETFKQNNTTIPQAQSTRKIDSKQQSKVRTWSNAAKCEFCSKPGHTEAVCRSKNITCYICNKKGHTAKSCPDKGNGGRQQAVDKEVKSCNFTPAFKLMFKQVKINSVNINALVDTGSDVTIIQEDFFKTLKPIPEILPSEVKLTGFGNTAITPLGAAEVCITTDDTDVSVTVKCEIVSAEVSNVPVLLGKDLLGQINVLIEKGHVKFEKPTDVNNIFTIEADALDDKIPQEIQKLIDDYKPNPNFKTDIQTNIVLKSDERVYQNPRRLAQKEKEVVEKQIADWLEKKIISPSISEYASPIVLAKKKDLSLRLCIDYRRLNKNIVKDHFPTANIEEQLDKLQGAKFFSTLDLENGFFHVPVAESSKKYTAFCSHIGIFEFNRTPFGLCNSPSSFQRFITHVFRELIRKNIVLLYMDDIIIPSKTYEEGMQNLKLTLSVAAENGLNIKWKKCQFLQQTVEYLGFIIEDGKIKPSDRKLKAVSNFPEPDSCKAVQSFLGLTGFFRKFIMNYAAKSAPLSDLLKKDIKFEFTDTERTAFLELKTALSSSPILHIYNPDFETELHTDASAKGYGAILLQRSSVDQKLHPIYYYSKKTTPQERNYSSYELEVLAVINALNKLRVYLLNKHFKIITDCKAFSQTMEKKELSPKIARWALALQEFDYEVEHRSGTRMQHVDALSRYPVPAVFTVSARIQRAQEENNDIKEIIQKVTRNELSNYSIANNILYKQEAGRDLIVLPDKLAENIIRKCHEDNGHFGAEKLEQILRQQYSITKLGEKVKKCISNCVVCLISDRKRGKKEGQLHPIPKEDRPLETFHIDHLGPMTSTDKQYKYILAIIDAFTKFCWLYPTKTMSASETLSKIEILQSTFGNPSRIISDKGGAFTSTEFAKFCEDNNINHITITTGIPRANGQVERLNSTIISVLTKLCQSEPKKWYKQLSSVQTVLNSTYQRAIGTTPFQVLTGVRMKTNQNQDILQMLNDENMENFEEQRLKVREDAKTQIAKIQEENRKQHNKKTKSPHAYVLGDLVLIKRTQFGTAMKLKPHFLGPYRITKKKRNDRYDVEKITTGEGPMQTSTSADNMKLYGSA